MNTNLVYKQQKYNLLREEVEGYSRLSLLLSQQVPVEAVLSAIGGFDLDPNRVLDIILDFMETHSSLSYMELLKSFRVSNIVHILGNKFLAAGPQVTGSLFRLAAVLIMMDYVDLVSTLFLLLLCVVVRGWGLMGLHESGMPCHLAVMFPALRHHAFVLPSCHSRIPLRGLSALVILSNCHLSHSVCAEMIIRRTILHIRH